MHLPRLEQWGVRRYHGGKRAVWLAPESNPHCLYGKVYGHYYFQDGHQIKTSPIVGHTGRIIHTERGSSYELGEPDPGYLDWLAQQGETYNPEEPIREKRK